MMDKIFLISMIFGFTMSANGDAFDSCQNKNPKWFECEKNKDCAIIANPCGHPTAAANTKYSKDAEKCNITQGAALSCATWDDMRGGKTKAVCQKKICLAEKTPTKKNKIF